MGTEPREFLTGPQLAMALGVSLDTFRRKVQRRPDLKAFFEYIGPARVLRAARLREFRAAFAAK